jgi:rhodanese-related sulfurtransferase
MWVQAAGIALIVMSSGFVGFAAGSVLLGAGTAMVYPTLLAAIGDVAHPTWRASSVGIYRLWRDLGYAIGAVIAGITADALGIHAAIWVIAALTFASGLVVAVRMRETHARKPPPSANCISPDELATRAERGEPLAIIDVRSRDEFTQSHVDGAINIPIDELPDEVDRLRSAGHVITVCGKGGGRSATAAQLLRDRGIERAWWLCGGTDAWRERAMHGDPA